MPVDSINEVERTPTSAGTPRDDHAHASNETLRVRCPHCRKLYMVQFADIQEPKPRFECVQCRQRFWLALADQDLSGEVTGLPIKVKDAPVSTTRRDAPPEARRTDPCPKCFKPNEVNRTECAHCGIVIEKARQQLTITESTPPHSAILASLWKKVVGDYADEAQHQEFVRACQRERNLAFAGAQYGQMQKLMPGDDLTERRVREIQALALAMVPSIQSPLRVRRNFPRLWHIPLIVATAIIITGMLAPAFRNLVGVGAAIAFIATALHLHFRGR